jgi:DNA-binding response OmpR family regulator
MSKILIVEDDDWLADQHRRALEKAGYETVISPHALDAVVAIDDVKPDAIVLDILLTGNTGFTLLHELQSYSDTAIIPVVICSNVAEDLALESMAPYGVKRIVDKTTMLPDDIAAAVRGILT